MELIGEIVRENTWIWLLASGCLGMGFYALVREAQERLGYAGNQPPSPIHRLEQFEQLARHANGQGVSALPTPTLPQGDQTVRCFLEIARRGMPAGQLKSCLDGEIEHKLALCARRRRWAAIGAAACLGFGLCGLSAALVFALRQAVLPSGAAHFAAPAALGAAAGLMGIPLFYWLRSYSRRSESVELLDFTLIATGIEAIAQGEEPNVVRAKLGQLLPGTSLEKRERQAA